MKKIIPIVTLASMFGCMSTNKAKSQKGCIENIAFKNSFFSNIENIDSLIKRTQNKAFKKSLSFISNYTHVSFQDMANYSHTYPYGSFLKDKAEWLKWYEENKCKNIQVIH